MNRFSYWLFTCVERGLLIRAVERQLWRFPPTRGFMQNWRLRGKIELRRRQALARLMLRQWAWGTGTMPRDEFMREVLGEVRELWAG